MATKIGFAKGLKMAENRNKKGTKHFAQDSGNVGDNFGEAEMLADVFPEMMGTLDNLMRLDRNLRVSIRLRGGSNNILDDFVKQQNAVTVGKIAQVLIDAASTKRPVRHKEKKRAH